MIKNNKFEMMKLNDKNRKRNKNCEYGNKFKIIIFEEFI